MTGSIVVRPWPRSAIVLSALAIGVVEVVGSFGAARNSGSGREGMDALAIALVLIGPLALTVRDRWPLAVLAATLASSALYVALGYVYGPIFLSVVVALGHAVLAGRRHGAWILAGIGFVAYVLADRIDGHDEGEAWLKAAVVAGWIVVVLVAAELLRARRAVAREQAVAAAEERQRREGEQRLALAQELHDVLAHHISLINVQAGVALHLVDDQPERAKPALAEIKEASREALRELRGALDVLRRGDVAPRAPAPTLADLDRLAATVRASGLAVHLEEGPRPSQLPAAVQLATYRIVQEALTNVSRHAGARGVTVRIRYDEDVHVEIVDDGVGGVAGPGNGITGMRERARSLGGELTAGPGVAGGFRVVARLPIGAGVPS